MADVAIIDGSGGDYLVPPNKIEEVDQVTIRPDKQLPNETKVSPEIVHQTYQICNKLATTPTLTTLAHPERSKHILYANDRVAKFSDEGQLLFGFVSINRVTKDTRIDWDNGKEEKLSYTGGKGIALKAKVGVMDRRCVGFGSKVTNDEKTGQVREKRFLITVALENNLNVVIKDVDCEDLIRIGYSKKDDKIVYNNEWVGLVADTRAGVYFKMDKDGKLGFVPDDSYGFVFPRPGDRIESMLIYHLWDTRWITSGQIWWWNFFRYMGNSATILETKIDCITLAWMRNINMGKVFEIGGKSLPPNTLRREEEVKEVKHLYGRNWKYIRELDTWNYKLKEEDKLMNFHDWVLELSEETFFGPPEDYVLIGNEEKDNLPQMCLDLMESEKPIGVKIAAIRSVVDIEWDDGSIETLPSYKVKPHQYDGTDTPPAFFAGDIVSDLNIEKSSTYGYVVRVYRDTALVTWIDPSGHHLPKISQPTRVPISEIGLHIDYLYLKSLNHIPVVVSNVKNIQGMRIPVDDVLYGVAVGINVAEAKIIVKGPDEVERLVWAHDFEHFEGDVAYDTSKTKWIPWYKFDTLKNPIRDFCLADQYLRDRKLPLAVTSTTIHEDNGDVAVKPKIMRYLDNWFSSER